MATNYDYAQKNFSDDFMDIAGELELKFKDVQSQTIEDLILREKKYMQELKCRKIGFNICIVTVVILIILLILFGLN